MASSRHWGPVSSPLAAQEGNTRHRSAFILLHQPSVPVVARKGVNSTLDTTALPQAPLDNRAVCRAGMSRDSEAISRAQLRRRRNQPLWDSLQQVITKGELGSKAGGAPPASLGFPRWCHSLGEAKGWSLGCHALRGPLARGKELDPEPCLGTAGTAAAEHSWCLGTRMHCPSRGGHKGGVRVWQGRASTSSTSQKGQERRRDPTIAGPLSLGAGDNPKARTRAPLPSCQALHRDGVKCLVSLLLPPNHLSTKASATVAERSCSTSVSPPGTSHPR